MRGVAEKVRRGAPTPSVLPTLAQGRLPGTPGFTAGCHTPGGRVPGSQTPRGTPLGSRWAATCQVVGCRVCSPDLDGWAAEHLPVAVPAAAGGAAAAGGRVLAAQLSQPLLPAAQHAAVLVFRGLRHKLELLDAIDFHEGEVKLERDSQTGTCAQRRCAGGMSTSGPPTTWGHEKWSPPRLKPVSSTLHDTY